MSTISVGRAAAFVAVAALGFAGLAIGAGAGPGNIGEVTIVVPGAMNLAVHCGGDQTHFADGEEIRLVPEGTTCDIEAPLSPVMPLRGDLVLDGWSTAYRCRRKAMELHCAPE